MKTPKGPGVGSADKGLGARSQVCSQKNDALRLGGPSEPWPLGVTGSCISSARMLVALGHAVPGPTGQRVATPAPDLRRAGASPLGRGLRQPPRRNVLCFEVPHPPRREEPQRQGPRPSAAVAQPPASAQHPLVRPAPGAMWGLSPRPHSRSPCPRGQPAAQALRAASPADGQRPLRTAPRQLLPLCLRHTLLLGDSYLDYRLFPQSPGAVRPPPPEATLPRT